MFHLYPFRSTQSNYRTVSDSTSQKSRRQLPALPQPNSSAAYYNEDTSAQNISSATQYVGNQSHFHHEIPTANVVTSGRTTPTIIFDQSLASSGSERQNRFLSRHQ